MLSAILKIFKKNKKNIAVLSEEKTDPNIQVKAILDEGKKQVLKSTKINRKTLIIRGGLIFALAFMALDYFLESPKPSPAQEELVDTKSEQKNAEINSAQINPESTLPTIPHIPEETISADTPTPTPTPTPSELLPPPAEELPSEMEKPEIEKEESEPVITEAVPPTPAPVEVDLPTDVKIESASPVSVDSYVAEKEVVNSNLAYIPAPNYLDAGRGLVYNCTHKHWACVSAESYIQCDQNQKWSKQEKKNPECFIAEIYLNIQDCHKAQIIKVDTSADTGFCHL